MDKQLLEQEASDYANRKTEGLKTIFDYEKEAYIAGRSKGLDENLLSFCHWIGKKGYKINGYDDSQLITIINQFKTENNF